MKQSAGILLYKTGNKQLKVLLAHPGGPFWKKKDHGSWSIPKGELNETEDALQAAKREFLEETGVEVTGNTIPLTPIKQKGGKLVHAWAVEQDFDTTTLKSNTFEMEWPPKSGKLQSFPEVDRVEWFTPEEARKKIREAQWPLIAELITILEKISS